MLEGSAVAVQVRRAGRASRGRPPADQGVSVRETALLARSAWSAPSSTT